MAYQKQIGRHTVRVDLEILDTGNGTFSVAYPNDPSEHELDIAIASGKTHVRRYAEGNNNATKQAHEETRHWTTGAATFTILVERAALPNQCDA